MGRGWGGGGGGREALLKEPRGKPLGRGAACAKAHSGRLRPWGADRGETIQRGWRDGPGLPASLTEKQAATGGGVLSRQVTPSKLHFSQDPSGCLWKMGCREERVRGNVGRPWRSHRSLREASGWIQEGAALRNWSVDRGRAELGEGLCAPGTEAGLVDGDKRGEGGRPPPHAGLRFLGFFLKAAGSQHGFSPGRERPC